LCKVTGGLALKQKRMPFVGILLTINCSLL
jgi:hypothetical protein